MMLIGITLTIALGVVAKCVDGNQRIVYVSELNGDNINFTRDKSNCNLTCCVYGYRYCNSLDCTLANLDLDCTLANLDSNILINVTTDVMLSTIIKRSSLESVSIVGHNSPTVNCKHG